MLRSQMTVALTQLINALHSLKSSVNSAASASVQSLQKDFTAENNALLNEVGRGAWE